MLKTRRVILQFVYNIGLQICLLLLSCFSFLRGLSNKLNSIATMRSTRTLQHAGCRHGELISQFRHIRTPRCYLLFPCSPIGRCTNLFDLHFIYSPINRRLRLNGREKEKERGRASLPHVLTSCRVYLQKPCRKFRRGLFGRGNDYIRSHLEIHPCYIE